MVSISFIKSAVVALFAGVAVVFFLIDAGAPVNARIAGEAIASPTGVMASDGDYSNKVGIHWDTIRGANLYRIFRSATNNSAIANDIGTTAANYFFDPTPVAGQTYFYWIRAENGTEQSSLSTPNQGTKAVGLTQGFGQIAPLEPPPVPAGNPVTAAKAYLGKALFWDEQMSSTRTVSCGTCHRPAAGGSDPRTAANLAASRNPGFDQMFGTADDVFGSPGVPQNLVDGTYVFDPVYGFNNQVTGRRSPTYLNAAYSRNGLFWDGRATDAFRDQLTNNVLLPSRASLESQSAGPPASLAEMAHNGRNWTDIAARIQASKPLALATEIPSGLATWIGGRSYPELFQEAFGSADVTPAKISMAIATHERTLFSDRTPFDRFLAEIEPLSQSEENGFNVFLQSNCNVCHSGPLLTDQRFHNIGLRPVGEDTGHGAVSQNTGDDGRFKTPNMRNGELHAPYMHNGRFASLEEVVDFYDRGGDFQEAPNFESGAIRVLNLTAQEKADLVTFMKRPLTDLRVKNELPPFDRPKLFTESNRVPVVNGTGRAGSGAIVPMMTAISPPLVGNPNFTVSVSRVLGNSSAVLVLGETDPGIGIMIPATSSLIRVTAITQNIGAGNGWASVSVPIPNDQALVGKTFYGRWYIEDATAANGFSVSQVVQFTVFGNAVAVPTVSISGRITTPSGLGLRNAVVGLIDGTGGRRTATTSSFGVYQFANIPAGTNYTMSIASKRYRFSSRIFDITGNLANFDFVGLE